MPDTNDNSSLANRHYVTLILRLSLDCEGHVIWGELADTTASCPKHFISTTGLHNAVTAWLKQQEKAEDNPKT